MEGKCITRPGSSPIATIYAADYVPPHVKRLLELKAAGQEASGADDDGLLVRLTSEYHSTADFEAQVDELRLLIDTGSAISIVSSGASQTLGLSSAGRDHVLRSRDGLNRLAMLGHSARSGFWRLSKSRFARDPCLGGGVCATGMGVLWVRASMPS